MSFELDVVPILSKAGCNGGGCHGKSGGQNGFALSLLGFVPELDYQTLAKENRGRRILPKAETEAEAMGVYRPLVEKHKLDMKPIDVEYLFGGDKIVFYFSSEERVDFRELVRDLSRDHRCIAVDHVGCGLSDKPGDDAYGYTLQDRVEAIAERSIRWASLRIKPRAEKKLAITEIGRASCRERV